MSVIHLPLARSLGTVDVAALAGRSAYQRGLAYVSGGRVHVDTTAEGIVTATVAGTTTYAVRLGFGPSGLVHECSCPIGVDGRFCKHLVAVAAAVGGPSPALDWVRQAHAVLDEVERVLAAGRRADALAFCERAASCLRDGAGVVADQVAMTELTGRLDVLRRRAQRSG